LEDFSELLNSVPSSLDSIVFQEPFQHRELSDSSLPLVLRDTHEIGLRNSTFASGIIGLRVRNRNTLESALPDLLRDDRLEPHAIDNNKAPLPPTNDSARSEFDRGFLADLSSTQGNSMISSGVLSVAFNLASDTVVRHQEERGQRVIDSGSYRFVRHPMYSAVIPLLVGMSLWLGSFAGTIVAIVPTVVIGIRAMLEEKFLCRELPGYAEYISRTRFRMIPYLW
jgi:hypothetical protein